MGNYLYNGVELPALPVFPTWEKVYAYITVYSDSSGGSLVFSSVPLLVTGSTINNSFYATADGTIIKYRLAVTDKLENSAWEYQEESAFVDGENVHWTLSKLTWANADTYKYSDGTLYLAASDPIPVSTFTPDPISMTMGWLVGIRIAGQRN